MTRPNIDARRRRFMRLRIPVDTEPKVATKLITWRRGGPTFRKTLAKHARHRGENTVMQKEFTIQVRVDYADKGKNAAMHKAIQIAGRHVYATATLLADGVKPQIAMYSDDFFDGHEDIKLFDDTIQVGIDQLDTLNPTGLNENMDGGMEGVSNELLEAMRTK